MGELRRTRRLVTVGGVLIAVVVCAVAFCYLRPFDWYLLKCWEGELATLADHDVEVRLEQIAALGERSLPTLVAALHSDRQIVALTAASVLRRELDRLELRSTDQSSQIVAGLAHELAARSSRPGPYSAPASTQLATRLLLWPINRKLIDGERLVADCELIIRSASRSTLGTLAEQADVHAETQDALASRGNELGAAELLNPVAGGGLPLPLMDAPPLPPQNARVLTPSRAATTTEPPQFIALQAPSALDPLPSFAGSETTAPESSQPARPNARAMADLDLIRMLADSDQSLVREAVDELYRRGFQTKHLRLAALLVDPDPSIRLALVRSLPQMSGIESRPWLVWLSRDPEPTVRKAAVAVIATSSDSALLQHVRDLEREETDDEVLQVVRQILNTRQTMTFR